MIKEEAIEILSDMRAGYNIFSDDEEEATRYHALSLAIQALNEQQRTGRWTGRWIKHEVKRFDGFHTGRFFDECSECGKLTPEWRKITEYHRWNYCPSCGAEMEVGE